MKIHKLLSGLVILVVALTAPLAVTGLGPVPAQADTYYFYPLASGVPSAVTSNLKMDVTDAGGGSVSFTISNLAGGSGEITAIYFYDGALLGATMNISNNDLVQFDPDSGKLPGGGTVGIPMNASAAFGADRDNPNQTLHDPGINPGESLTITFSLASGKTFDNVIASLDSWFFTFADGQSFVLNDGMLAVGFHLQELSGDPNSSGFVVVPTPPTGLVPLPPSALLLGTGLLGLLAVRRWGNRG